MYIKAVETISHSSGHGMKFDSLDEVASAIQELGHLMHENPEGVAQLIRQMRSSIEEGIAYSAFAHVMMRHCDSPEYVSPSGTVATKQGYVIGGQFFVHNAQGLTHRAPFCNLEVRVDTIEPTKEDAPKCYHLKLTDNAPGGFRTGLEPPKNHTDSWLAYDLSGQDRPITHINVVACYAPAGPVLEFDLEPILEALGSVGGLGSFELDPGTVAESYYRQEVAQTLGDNSHYVTLKHTSGAKVCLIGFIGIKAYSDDYTIVPGLDTLIHKQLIDLNGSIISGPSDGFYADPQARFTISAGDETTNNQLITLAEGLEAALWAHNY